ncbi:MAG: DNA polymerase III subunit delta [Bacillota bacterium]|nr:DNA polymerase III subunit delta [Bacillota bacterium]
MINFVDLEENIKKGKLHNCYLLCGFNEELIKENIRNIADKVINKDFFDLNYVQFDGASVSADAIYNACETLPFMSDKKVVVVYRADFLLDKPKGGNRAGSDILKEIEKFLDNIPERCILIMYYVYENDREKPSYKIKKMDKKACVVEFTKLKGAALQKKVKEVFDAKGKDIGKIELGLFCNEVENNMDIIINEVEKLCCYTGEREISREDILSLLPQKSDNDVFNLVDFLSQKKVEKALDVLNELIYRGEKETSILAMIERQFKILISLKIGMAEGKGKETLASELKLHPFICEKMMGQCKKFSLVQLERILDLCLETEKMLKSSSSENRIQIEMLMIGTVRV